MAHENRQGMKGGCRRRTLKILGFLALALVGTLGLLFVTGKLLTARLEPETDPHAFDWGPGTSFVSTRSGEVHVLDIGEGDVILLTHGSGGSIAAWQEGGADRLAESYRVVAFDDYGFGLSERNHPGEYSNVLWEQQAIDVLDALDIQCAVVLGHSAGAIVAATLAADHPERVRGVILTGHGLAPDPVQMIPLLPGVGEISLARSSIVGDNFETFSESHRARLEQAYSIRGTRAAYLTFVRSQYGADSLRLLKGTYEDIQDPVLQMHGTLDESIPIDVARELSPRLADTRFVEIEGSGHHVHAYAPDQWAEEINEFVESLPPMSDPSAPCP